MLTVALAVPHVRYWYTRWFSTVRPFDLKRGILAPLLIPRVPNTLGHIIAEQHIVHTLEHANWKVEEHEFEADTPIGKVPMKNIMASFGSGAESSAKYTLAAHYDSKPLPEGFIGAIDSAFPCALLMRLAELANKRTPTVPFDLIFFDGEEAYKEWSDEDSTYGSRALAKKLKQENSLPQTLVLLDLLGCENPPIPSWFKNTQKLHKQLHAINPKLVGGRPVHEYGGYMQDDHIPFLKLGVPVLHLIPTRFPDVWHTLDDNAECLDEETMYAWLELFEKWLFE